MPSSENTSKGKKKGGGFLSRQVAKSKKTDPVTEEQLLRKDAISPEDIKKLEKATDGKF